MGKFQLEVHGSLAALLALGRPETQETPRLGAMGFP